jgi:vitamin B12 transporter
MRSPAQGRVRCLCSICLRLSDGFLAANETRLMDHSFRSSSAVSLLALMVSAPVALAQQPIPLPGIVIQGATLEKAPVAKPRVTKPVADDNDDDTPPAPKEKVAAQKPAPTQKAAPVLSSAVPVAVAAPSGDVAPTSAGPRAGIPASEIGTAVSIVTAQEIEQRQLRTTADVLRAMPGVTVTGFGSPGQVVQVRLRGAEGRHTRVLIDGVEANTTKDAEFDFSNLSPEDVERIEIIRGPMSALYGSGAIGGVINITTKSARGPLGLSVRVEGGSFGTKDLSGRLAGGNENGFISLTGQVRDVRGFPVAPGGVVSQSTTLQTYGLHAGVTVAPAAKLDMTLRYTDKRAGFPDFGASDPSPTKPFATADDANNKLIERSLLGGVRLSWDSFGSALTQELKTNYSSDVSSNRFQPLLGFAAGTINNSRDEGARLTYGYSATYRLPTDPAFGRHAVTGLIEKQTETFKPFSDFDTSFGDYNGDGVTRTRSRVSYAGEWRGTFAERLSLTAGARRDDNDTFQDFNTWRTSASFDWREAALRPHASLGTGVKLPGLYDQFGSNTSSYQSNPLLRPETSRGYDVGVETKLLGGRVLADVTYFNADLKDKIGLNGFDLGTFKSFPTNAVGVSTRRGVEVSGQYQITPVWFVGAAYTYTDARQPNGTAEVRRVPHGGRLDVRYLFDEGKGTVTLAAIGNSRTPDYAFSNDGFFNRSTVQIPGYWTLQLGASYKVAPNVEVYGRIENAFNTKYQEVYGYNTAGIGAYAGVKFKFDDLVGSGKK